MSNPSQQLSFDEFKLYYQSTEKVTDRRLRTNRWNYSICTAILVAVAGITNWSLTSTTFVWVGLAAVLIMCVMAMLFCALWVGQIRDFKKLNNAKFTVLNAMAPLVVFRSDKAGQVVSYCPFEKEWKELEKMDALDQVAKTNIIALRSSNIEYFIPKAFLVLFGGIVVVLVAVVLAHWPPSSLVQPPAPTATSAQGKK